MCTPQEANKYICKKTRNKIGEIALKFETISGVELPSSNPSYKDTWNNIDEIGMCFHALERIDQKILISFLDPFGQLEDNNLVKQFYKENNIHSEYDYQRKLVGTLMKFQMLAERKGLTKRMIEGDDELRGWDEICKFLDVCYQTAREWAAEYGMPIISVSSGTSVVSSKTVLKEWRKHLYKTKTVAKTKKICNTKGCTKIVRAKGMCVSCYYKNHRKKEKANESKA